jgi:transposase
MGKAIGLTTAAVIVSEAGDPTSFKCAAAYEKAMGLNVKINSSGKCKPGRISITKRGSGKCRKYLYLAVLRMIQSDRIVRAWYLKKVERDGGVKMKALIAIMRKLSRALWHLAKGNEFDSKLLFDTRRLNLTGA